MPAIQEEEDPEDKVQMPLLALGFSDEPSPPDGLVCGAVLYDKDNWGIQYPCILAEHMYCSSDDEDLLYS